MLDRSFDMDLAAKFKKNILQRELLQVCDRVLVAVSGGLDSVVLLDLLRRLSGELELKLRVVHVNHQLRGREAELDAAFVRDLAAEHDLPFTLKLVDTPAFLATHSLSIEEGARVLRYRAFEEVLAETSFPKLATAHSATDQTETVLDRLLRGAGLRGLGGMSRCRGPYVRPLLDFARPDLVGYAQSCGLSFREDSSNRNMRFKRNRIRADLLPLLETRFNPSVTRTINHSAEVFREADEFLDAFANNAFKSLVFLDKKNEIILDLERFINYFDIVKKYIIFEVCDFLGVERADLTFDKLERILALVGQRQIGKKVLINQDCELFVDHDGIVVRRGRRDYQERELRLYRDRSSRFDGYEFRWSIADKSAESNFIQDARVEVFDLETLASGLYLRIPAPGDKFVPLNFSGHKKVADYLSDRKVPHRLRNVTPVLLSGQKIVWLCGYCIDDRFKVTEKTRRVLRMEMIDLEDDH